MQNNYSINESEMIQAIINLGNECDCEDALAAYYKMTDYESSLD